MRYNRKYFRMPNVLLLVSGCLSTMLGLVVLVGWCTHHPRLFQLLPNLLPMQFNTAILFVCCGLGLLSIPFKKLWVSKIAGFVIAGTGLLTLTEYIFGINIGIDQFLITDYLSGTVGYPHPGRIAVTSAICAVISGIALFLMGLSASFKYRSFFLGILGALVLSIGESSFIGYIFGLSMTLGWGGLTRMAIHTAIGFVLVGAAIVAYGWKDGRSEKSDSPRWLPLMVGISVAMITIGLWQALRIAERSHIEQTIKLEQENAKNQISTEIESRASALVRMAKRWDTRGETPEAEWTADAEAYLKDFKGFQAIEWVDQSYHIRRLVNASRNKAFLGRDLSEDPDRKRALEQSRDQRTVVITKAVTLANGGRGFHVCIPLFNKDGFDGYILGFFRLEAFVDAVLDQRLSHDFYVGIYEDSREIYHSIQPIENRYEAGLLPSKIDVYNINWQVQIWPRTATVAANRSSIDEAALVVGFILTIILSWTVYLAQTARRREKESIKANEQLHMQIAQRRLAESALQQSETRYRNSVEHGLGLMCIHDLDGGILFVNRAAADLFGYEPDEMVGHNLELITPPKLRSQISNYLAEIKASGTTSGIWQVATRNGEQRTLMFRNTIKQEAGKDPYVLGHAQDITELRRAHIMLADVNTHLKAVLDASTEVAIVSTDLNGLITVFNSGAERMLGYKAEEMVGIQTQQIIHCESEVRSHAENLSEELGRTIEGFDALVERARNGGPRSQGMDLYS